MNTNLDITLLMIVKNEQNQISRCLNSCKALVSNWLIVDTGSTDHTKEIIAEELKDVPGRLIERPWIDFGHNRTELLDLFYNHQPIGSDERYMLLLDADCEIRNVNLQEMQNIPQFDQYLVKVTGGSLEYRMPYFVRASKRYRYVGATHEYLTCDENTISVNFDGFEIHHFADGGSRSDKFDRDRLLLQQELDRDPSNARAHFYLGQTLNDLGEFENSLNHYIRAFEHSTWREERFISALRAGKLSEGLNRENDALAFYHQAIETSPNRSEGYYHLGKLLNKMKFHTSSKVLLEHGLMLPPSEDILFIERWIEQWGLKMEFAVALWWNNEKTAAADIFCSILLDSNTPTHVRKLAQDNLDIC